MFDAPANNRAAQRLTAPPMPPPEPDLPPEPEPIVPPGEPPPEPGEPIPQWLRNYADRMGGDLP
jgi:hypothetical protein